MYIAMLPLRIGLLGYIAVYCTLVLSCCLLYFTLILLDLFAVNFVIFSLWTTMLLNLNLKLLWKLNRKSDVLYAKHPKPC